MIAVDTNILVYAHRSDTEMHNAAAQTLRQLAESPNNWAIPWPCIHEFIAIVTHPRIFDPPSTPDEAINQVEAWMESPSLVMLSETASYWKKLCHLIQASRLVGPLVHDARIMALCQVHGTTTLWTADRDFSRFPGVVTITNPLLT